MTRGFYVVATQDRVQDLKRFLHFLLKFNRRPVFVAVADDKLDAHRKKAMVGMLSPFESTVMLDLDMLVNGNLDFLFQVAELGMIGLFYEEPACVFNSGVIALRKGFAAELTGMWLPAYEEHVKTGRYAAAGSYDQFVLNQILKSNVHRFPVHQLLPEYNYILKHHTPEQESADFDGVKIFHFLHDRDPQFPIKHEDYKSFQIYMGV